MKLIAVLFLVGFALSYALSAPETQELSLDEVEELDFVLGSVLEAEERSIGDDLKRSLKDTFDALMEKAKDLIEKGKELNDMSTDRLKIYIEKLKDFGYDVHKKAKEMGKNLSGKAKEAYEKFLERLGINSSNIKERSMVARSFIDDLKTFLEDKMKRWREQWKEQLEQGREISEKAIEAMKSVLEKAKRIGMDMDTKFRKWAEEFTGEAKEKIEEILDKLGVNKNREARSIPNDVKADLAYILKMKVQRLKLAIEEEQHDRNIYIQKLMSVMPKLHMPNVHVHQELNDLMDTFKGNESEKSLLNDVKKDRKNMLKRKVEKLSLTIMEEQQDRDSIAMRMMHILPKLHVTNTHVTQELERLINAFTGNERKRGIPSDVKEHLEYILKRTVLRLKVAVDEEQLDRNMLVEKMMHLLALLQQPSMYAGQELNDLINTLTANESDAEEGLEKTLKVKLQRLKIAMDEAENDRNMNIQRAMHVLPQLHQPTMDVHQELNRLLEDFTSNSRSDRFHEKTEKRSIKEVYEKIREYLKNLKIELKEKFTKFGEWAKEKYEKGLEQGRDRAENLKKLAKEFIADAKNISKDVAEQAKEFFREYKEDLGNVYEDVRDKIKDILAKKE